MMKKKRCPSPPFCIKGAVITMIRRHEKVGDEDDDEAKKTFCDCGGIRRGIFEFFGRRK